MANRSVRREEVGAGGTAAGGGREHKGRPVEAKVAVQCVREAEQPALRRDEVHLVEHERRLGLPLAGRLARLELAREPAEEATDLAV